MALEEITEPDAIAAWLEEPNEMFNGATPLDLIEIGESDRIWQMIYRLRSGEPL